MAHCRVLRHAGSGSDYNLKMGVNPAGPDPTHGNYKYPPGSLRTFALCLIAVILEYVCDCHYRRVVERMSFHPHGTYLLDTHTILGTRSC